MNVFISYKFLLNYISQFAIINNYYNVKIFARFTLKPYSQIKRIVKIKFMFILLFNFITNILINYYDIFSNDRDYLFELKLSIFFNKKEGIFAYIIDSFITFI